MINTEDLYESKYFTKQELSSPDDPNSWKLLNREFLFKLSAARHTAKIPFILNSCVRTESHNKSVGGKKTSSHLPSTKGGACAADIQTSSSKERWIIHTALKDQGFTRFGIGKTFIHVDSDQNKEQEVEWTYYKK